MVISCKLCSQKIQSGKPDIEAQSEVMTALSRHLKVAHLAEFVELGKLCKAFDALIATYLLLCRYVTVTEAESAILASFDENKRVLSDILDFDHAQVAVEHPVAARPN